MPITKLTIRPGINTMATQTANEGGWSLSNLIRWHNGWLEKIGGWAKLFSTACAGKVRAIYAYQDINHNNNLLIGGDGGLQVYFNGALNTLGFSKNNTTPYAGTAITTFVPTGIGSKVVTVTDPSHGASSGDLVSIGVTLSIGGIVLLPQTVTITGATTNTWTFNLASNATTTTNGSPPVYLVASGQVGTTNVTVRLENHGLSVSSSFVVQFSVVWNVANVANVPAGTYTVTSVTDADNFIISAPTNNLASTTGLELGFNPSAANVQGLVPLSYIAGNPVYPYHWFLDNLGTSLIIGFEDAAIYEWTPPLPTSGTGYAQRITTAPQINRGTFVAMPQAQVIAFGSEETIVNGTTPGNGVQDALLVRWSDAGSYSTWIASSTNQAGSFRLSRGSLIVGGMQAPQSTLLWTDLDLWSMAYIAPPLVYSFTIIGTGCGLFATKARTTLGRNTYWMSQKGFFVFGDSGVQQVECPIWDNIFNNINASYIERTFAGTDEPFNEVLWFYPSTTSTGECDSFVKFNPATQLWDYGSLSRTAWIGTSVFGMPLGADLTYHIQQHETGYDNDTAAMSGAYAETGFFEIGDGNAIPFVDQLIPDLKWFGSNGSVSLTLWASNYPSDTSEMFGPFTVTPQTRFIPVRVRARQIALRIDWAPIAGFTARLGGVRAQIASAGRAAQ